jgi:Tol biopolymer transport system component
MKTIITRMGIVISGAIFLVLLGCKKETKPISSIDEENVMAASSRYSSTNSAAKIAFSSNRDGNFEIYVMNADGSAQTRLTNNAEWDVSPAWSPDRSKIAFSSRRDGNWEIYVMNADGSGVKRLTNDPGFDSGPEWSPDGTKIAFASDRIVTPWGIRITGIYIMNTDGSNVTAPFEAANYYYPDWSPDGQKFVFQSMRDGAEVYPTHDIWVGNVNGSGFTRLTDPNDGADQYPAWSPNGSQIAFVHTGIWVMNADGSAKRKLTNGFSPAWSPNGQQIAFEDTRDGGPCCVDGVYNVDIYSMNADGSAVKRLTNNAAYDKEPAWSR